MLLQIKQNTLVVTKRNRTPLLHSFVMVLSLFCASASNAQTNTPKNPETIKAGDHYKTAIVEIGKGFFISMGIADGVHVADSNIIDVDVTKDGYVFIAGKSVGSTTVTVEDKLGAPMTNYLVTVIHSLSQIRELIRKRYPNLSISLDSAEGSLMVSGTVPNTGVAEEIVNTLKPFVPNGDVIDNLLADTPQQLNLLVRIIEVTRSANEQYGIEWDALIQASKIKHSISSSVLNAAYSSDSNNSKRVDLNASIDLMLEKGIASLIYQSNLTAKSNKKTSLHVGRDIPVPGQRKQNNEGTYSGTEVDYKSTGFELNFVPVILDRDQLELTITSTISGDNNQPSTIDGNLVPSLSVSTISSTINLRNGESHIIADFARNETRETLQDVNTPNLRGIQTILNWIFGRDSVTSSDHNLAIIVTPYFARRPHQSDVMNNIMRRLSNLEYTILRRAKQKTTISGPRYNGVAGFAY